MGDKVNAKDSMRKIGVPVIYGSDGIINNVSEAKQEAENIAKRNEQAAREAAELQAKQQDERLANETAAREAAE